MGILIGDGKGGGGPWEIKKNRGQVDSSVETAFERHSHDGNSYSWTNVSYNMTAADTIISVRNTSSSKNLQITKVIMSTGVTTFAEHHVTDASAALAGTAITGVNLNFNSGNVAEADAKGDETTNSSQGTLILTSALVATFDTEVDWEGALILGTNDAYGIDYTVDDTTSAMKITIWGYFEDKE